MNIKGIFASDIDNTLTDKRHIIPDEVVNYLIGLFNNGWQIVFLTGRTFSFAMMSMEKFNAPFMLGVQNGAEVLSMPHANIIYQNFIQKETLTDLDRIFAQFDTGYIVYSGFQAGDFCYYTPNRFSVDMLNYFKKLQSLSSAVWTPVESFEKIIAEKFPLVKVFGPRGQLDEICAIITRECMLTASVITDTVDPTKGILLITAKDVDKGRVLSRLCKDQGWDCPVIAAGDDENDASLLDYADVSICVKGGSKRLETVADIVTPPSVEFGIIQGIEQAMGKLSWK